MTDEQSSVGRGRSILFVHGRDFKPDRESLLEICRSAVRSGIERDYPDHVVAFDGVRTDIAYYGDLSNEILAAAGRPYDPDLDLGDRKNALRALREIPVRKRFGIRQYDRLPGKSAVPEFFASFLYPILGIFGLTMPIINRLSRDFCEYLGRKTDYSEQVQARVVERLCEALDRDDELLLITHGTGSVIAYDVLWRLTHDPALKERYSGKKLDMWVTLGAPLGDRRIRKRLLCAEQKGAEPYLSNVICWHNVAAEDDYTCHDKTLADDFKKMMSQRKVSAVTDYLVFNHAVRYGRSNPHSSVGYYIHPRVAKIVADWIDHH
jgi:hypothetical protein